ncbi:MAG: protein-disulfide reductase DsbD family protein [Mangrovicoccus sp.]|nr:protein-disulfide reductase DsbD family protein [Mangrovicoccus sp.]
MEYLPGWQVSEGVEMGGIRITLEPGWKTYWRAPGDAGIPPQFSWAGSDNLRAVRIHWPRPEVFDTAGLRTIGYQDEVVLPVELFAKDPGKPVTVRGEAELGVCKDICLPANLGFKADSQLTPDAASRAITHALNARPRHARDLKISCMAEPISDGLRLTTRITLPSQGDDEVAVIEIGRNDVWVSQPEIIRQGSELRAVADLVPPNAAPFALDRSTVRLTVLGDDGAVDVMGCAAG